MVEIKIIKNTGSVISAGTMFQSQSAACYMLNNSLMHLQRFLVTRCPRESAQMRCKTGGKPSSLAGP
jgi:hypothetical protein